MKSVIFSLALIYLCVFLAEGVHAESIEPGATLNDIPTNTVYQLQDIIQEQAPLLYGKDCNSVTSVEKPFSQFGIRTVRVICNHGRDAYLLMDGGAGWLVSLDVQL